jgi:putative pyruvate formate lyase activating enzyme
MSVCNSCYYQCDVNRDTEPGICNLDYNIYIAQSSVVKNEEDFFNGVNGCGVIWFHGCNFQCKYCVNDATSLNGYGKNLYTISDFYNILINFITVDKVSHIMFVNPTMYVDFIIEVIDLFKHENITLPFFIYNTNAYDSMSTIEDISPYIDIFIPDYKYASDELALKLSNVSRYCEPCINTIACMGHLKGFNLNIENYMATSGMCVRHLMLPGEVDNTKLCIQQLKDINSNIMIHVLSNYAIRGGISTNKDLQQYNTLITDNEINEVKNFIIDNGYNNIFIK